MQYFRKYEFTPTQWAAAQKKIQKETTTPEGEVVAYYDTEKVAVVVELGYLCKAWGVDAEGMPVCTDQSTKLSVDIVWNIEPLTTSFSSYLVWPNPVGVSSMGYTLDQEYREAYCVKFPDYCKPVVPNFEV